MHIDSSSSSTSKDSSLSDPRPWYLQLSRYHWFVFVVAALGWLFDCLDQQLFVLARPAVMEELIPKDSFPDLKQVQQARIKAGDYATAIFMAGWATGGLFFGILGDRFGRAKTMVLTILLYSLFTGLSSFAVGIWDFCLYRFLTGLGVGGEFAVGVALVAEAMPTKARPYTLGLLQALSAVGNISAAMINLSLGIAEEQGLVESPWRIMFLIGAVPALLALFIRRRLKEPDTWKRASTDEATKKHLGSYSDLFRDPKLRKHALLGLVLGCSGIVGLWCVGFYTPDLIRIVQAPRLAPAIYAEQIELAKSAGDQARVDRLNYLKGVHDDATAIQSFDDATREEHQSISKKIKGRATRFQSYSSVAINIGAFCGMFGFGVLSQRIGRRPTFALAFLAAFLSTASVFWFLKDFWQIWVMVPIMGFCQLSLFAGYAIYFPELFPTRLRSTGTSFCYNVGRFVAALGPIAKAQLTAFFISVFPNASTIDTARYAGVTMSCVFLLGLVVLPFLPETRGQELPE
ncbi:MFS transporter [Planctomicrobium sp. SH668]|uniref:MFS transporter n=1 Tax=Planctomicrobium sp. SH668 TaxID=3448126 RepID=UPI003F5B9A2C